MKTCEHEIKDNHHRHSDKFNIICGRCAEWGKAEADKECFVNHVTLKTHNEVLVSNIEAERTRTLDEVREILKVEIKQSCACVKDYVCDLHTILKKISKLRLKGVPDKGRGGKT